MPRRKAIAAWTAFVRYTAVLGVHEFCSPTYYGTDINGLMMIQSYAKGERQRKQADALLRLFWTDIAANWFPAAQRLGGCHSRSYDYLRGIGALDWHLWVNGWLESRPRPAARSDAEPWADQWTPPPKLAEMARRQIPRLVRQHWGMLPAESRTQMIYPEVALSCCGAAYGNQDSTLVVDLSGSRDLPRCYFIADGREDPYGKMKFETGARKTRQSAAPATVLGRCPARLRRAGAGDLPRPGRQRVGGNTGPEPFRVSQAGRYLAGWQAAYYSQADPRKEV